MPLKNGPVYNLGYLAGPLVILMGSGLLGCSQLQVGGNRSPLAPPQMTADSAAVDIFFVRLPYADPLVERIWKSVDEQIIPEQLRKELYRNGFRIGRVAGPIPQEIAEILRLTDAPVSPSEVEITEAADVSEEATPTRRHLQMRPGSRTELLASDVYPEFPFLRRNEQGQVIGQTLSRAQGVFAMTLYPLPNNSVKMRLVPEIHFGEPRVQPVTTEGLIRWEMRRERIVLSDLTTKFDLAPGDMVILTCSPNQPGSLGGRFFTVESSGRREQKILALRLSQVQTNATFQLSPDIAKSSASLSR